MKQSQYKNKKGEDVDVQVLVNTRPNLRSGIHQTMLYSGLEFLKNIFDEKIIKEDITEVWFYYPETWSNIPELQCLMDFTFYFYPNIKKLRITTHSVYIVQTVRSSHMLVDNGKDLYPSDNVTPLIHMAPPPKNPTGLHIFTPNQ